MPFQIRLLSFTILLALNLCCSDVSAQQIYIRTTQAGFLPNDLKTGIIFSESEIMDKTFEVRTNKGGNLVFEGELRKKNFSHGKFSYLYDIDFSPVKSEGDYYIKTKGGKSITFQIGRHVFSPVVDSLMLFFQVQRCGPTGPILHDICHLSDATNVEGFPEKGIVDVTGGWHDAGDYIKFFSTTAYTTYMLLLAYDFDKDKFKFDNNKNQAPDVLEEARIGIDWLLRSRFIKGEFITQVQDMRDHEVGWRMPENDTLQYDRPGYTGMGKNLIGMYSAVMSLASRIWKERFYEDDFASKLLNEAEEVYKLRESAAGVDNIQSGVYQDTHFWGKLALGAVELYNSTKEGSYLEDAKEYADSAGSDYWWSWGNINSLAHYKLAKIDKKYSEYIKNNLEGFKLTMTTSAFNEGMAYTWGTTNTFLGISLQVILYKDITGSCDYDSLAILHRDYVLGRNPWGLSFIYNIGKVFPKHLHSQIAYFRNGYLPGALSAGPAPVSASKDYIIDKKDSRYLKFNTPEIEYYDDYNDYISNEPTIVGNATAVFVYGYYSNRK